VSEEGTRAKTKQLFGRRGQEFVRTWKWSRFAAGGAVVRINDAPDEADAERIAVGGRRSSVKIRRSGRGIMDFAM
jgi:hypothetical protein